MFPKKIRIISKKLKNLDGAKKASSYFNKPVVSKSGEHVGKVKDVVLKHDIFEGLIVYGNKKLYVGKEFISSDSKDHIILNVEPITNMIKKDVYDSRGKKIGYVKDVVRKSNSNTYSDILVKKSFFRRAFSIPKGEIGIARKSIILKNPYEPDKNKNKKSK